MKRRLDELGRIVIPPDMRNTLRLTEKSAVNINCIRNKIILTRAEDSCIICLSNDKLVQVGKDYVCGKCIERIKGIGE